jgi:hypothetical protein
MLIQSGQEKNLLPQAAPRPGNDVGDDLLVSVAKVRLAVYVINRGGDKKPFVHRNKQCDGRKRYWQSCAVNPAAIRLLHRRFTL